VIDVRSPALKEIAEVLGLVKGGMLGEIKAVDTFLFDK
jgi:hypothetical protein